ncbi:TRAP transporter large permease subunit [Pseudomonas sp. GOM7]|uniref:TRAP transporter large permease subunit n=1 Tax=unclassified Pseudomonas TaxID=196821 RepID=UPI00227CA317|nr:MULTISPECIES: TRAP transporter large permease subunit [unclassified Pseudomonas]WAJ36715.1 TRAP transporter large permease subunit [Pseudomonas sp. GOM7]
MSIASTMTSHDQPAPPQALERPRLGRWLSTLPVFLLLTLTLVIGTGEMLHGQLLRMGERLFGDPAAGVQYFMLRADPVAPTCDPNPDIDALMAKQPAQASSDIDDLFGDTQVDPQAQRSALQRAAQLCAQRHEMYGTVVAHITPELKLYRGLETSFFGIFRFGTDNRALLLLLLISIAGITTTLRHHHISLRPARTRLDHRVSSAGMVIANALLVFSCSHYLHTLLNADLPLSKPYLNGLWIALFSCLFLISVYHFLKPPADAEPGGNLGLALLSTPLYAVMAISSFTSFSMKGHYGGIAIYLGQLVELSGIFLNLALFIWSGMLLKQTNVVDRFLDLVRPWRLSPELLTWILLIGAAVPTAYTGASGIFVIAAGAIIYREVLLSGGRRQFALAVSAMSGSLGVVLRPCLLIVVVAALNKQVTTAELYNWGIAVFVLTSTLFFIASQVLRQQPINIAHPRDAMPAMARALVPVAPYLLIAIVVIWIYGYMLDTRLNEFTAPVMLPVILLVVLIFDKLRGEKLVEAPSAVENDQGNSQRNFTQAVGAATYDTVGHIGALTLLMALSVSTGGVIERSGLMELMPQDFQSIWLALTALMLVLFLIGMVMDAFGVVILVSATIAPIAYANGIHPVHFWMITLTAMELAYLSPPVALNHLLARQVVGEAEIDAANAEVRDKSFYYRYERWILPMAVMVVALLIVTYGGELIVQHGAQALELGRSLLPQ